METEIIIGIVVRTEKVKEADVRVRILTAGGLRTATAVGALKPAAKFKNAVQLFTIAEFSLVGHKIIGAHVLQSNFAVSREMPRFYLAASICDAVARIQANENAPAIFCLTAKALEDLSGDMQTPREIFSIYFTELLNELGFGVEENMSINESFARHLDIEIKDTKYFL